MSQVIAAIEEFVNDLLYGEDVAQYAISSKLIADDTEYVKNAISRVSLLKQREDYKSYQKIFHESMKDTRVNLNKFFRVGESSFIDALPTCNIEAYTVDDVAAKDIIDSLYGIDSTIYSSTIKRPYKDEYAKWVLQEDSTYNYRLSTNELDYTGAYGTQKYKYINAVYNSTNTNYDVTVTAYEDITTQYSTVTVITITSIDATNDNRNESIYDRTLVTGSITGTISDTSTLVSSTDTTIPAGSETDSTTEVIDATTVDYGVEYDSTIINTPSYVANNNYFILYYTTDSTDLRYWLYDETTGLYPTLSFTVAGKTNLDMLPVVTLKDNSVYVNSDTTSTRYSTTKRILKTLNMDLDDIIDGLKTDSNEADITDVFIHFGIHPNTKVPAVASVLFEMFDDIVDGTKSIAFSEGSLNSRLYWSNNTKSIVTGTIGELGYADSKVISELSGYGFEVRKQVTTSQYVVLRFYGMYSVAQLDKGQFVSEVNQNPSHDSFYIPVSIYHTRNLKLVDILEFYLGTLRLTAYAVSIAHLDWYETDSFKVLISVITVVVATILAGPVGFFTAMLSVIVLPELLSEIDDPFIKAVVITAILAASGGLSFTSLMSSALSLTELVSNYYSIYVEEEVGAISDDSKDLTEKANKESERLSDILKSYTDKPVTVDFMQELSDIKKPPLLQNLSYEAIRLQYDYDLLYNYDIMLSGFIKNKLLLKPSIQ